MKYGKKLNDGGRIFDYMNKGGKLRGYKMMEEGGETDPPKKHKKAAQALLKKYKEAASMVKSNPSDANQKALSQAKSEYENFTDDAKDAKAFSKESQEMEDGGKLRGYKFMAEGGETDPPKEPNYSGVQKIWMSGQMPTDERSLVELIETAQIEKNKTANKGITTGALMWTGSESGKDWMGVQGMSDEGKGIAAEYYDNLMAKAREKLRSVKGDKPSILEPGAFGRNLGGELEKGRSLEDIGETMEGKRGYKF